MENNLCDHDWFDLNLLEEENGLVCGLCEKTWVLSDGIEEVKSALLTIWGSSKRAIGENRLRVQEIERFINEKYSLKECYICEKLLEESDYVKIDEERVTCYADFGNHIELNGENFISEKGDSIELFLNKLLEKNNLKIILKNMSSSMYLSDKLAFILNSENEMLIANFQDYKIEENGFTQILAEKFGLASPKTDYGKAYLLNLVLSSRDEGGCDICELVVPESDSMRALITVDLTEHSLKNGGDFSLAMADSLLESINHRVYEEIRENL